MDHGSCPWGSVRGETRRHGNPTPVKPPCHPASFQYHIRELFYGSFKRQLRLPDNLNGEPVAELKDGILKLTFKLQLPEEKQPESRKIPI
ncbi:MAG: Hsp20 family protein [Planctomycetota bacterium]|nr:Hsp20 family protein [Planctomycetota bacterium]